MAIVDQADPTARVGSAEVDERLAVRSLSTAGAFMSAQSTACGTLADAFFALAEAKYCDRRLVGGSLPMAMARAMGAADSNENDNDDGDDGAAKSLPPPVRLAVQQRRNDDDNNEDVDGQGVQVGKKARVDVERNERLE